ncbi:plasmid partitioning protein RepB [Roseibium algae]|uniref:Plasmid partitioning protein RepB n=1 Tax=Roseibium algae TaxID=3123038 RepID=A0ABU8TRW2_9HYPH
MKKGILQTLKAGAEGVEQPKRTGSLIRKGKGSPVLASAERALRDLAGDSIVNLDPSRVEPSPFRDRMEEDSEAREAQDELKRSLLSEKQRLPVLVRPHPSKAGWYQLAYGHRRWQAIKQISSESDRPETVFLRAYVRELSDAQLIHEQTIENGVRENLSWIEKALWADQLKSTGIKQREMTSLLGVSESEVSRLFKVLSCLPVGLIRAIGRADGIGRPSWMDLAEKLKTSPEKLQLALDISRSDGFREMDSPNRFNHVLKTVGLKPKGSKLEASLANVTRVGDRLICSAKPGSSGLQLIIPKSEHKFGEWLNKNMEQFYSDFSQLQQSMSEDQERE